MRSSCGSEGLVASVTCSLAPLLDAPSRRWPGGTVICSSVIAVCQFGGEGEVTESFADLIVRLEASSGHATGDHVYPGQRKT